MKGEFWSTWEQFGPTQRFVTRQFASELQTAFEKYNRGKKPNWFSKDDEKRFWLGPAFKLIGDGADADEYMEMHFRQKPYPSLNTVVSENSIGEYHNYLKQTDPHSRANNVVTCQLSDIGVLMDSGRSLESILLEEKYLNPLIAYCLAMETSFADLSMRFEEDAKRFLRIRPAYRSVLGTLFVEPGGA